MHFSLIFEAIAVGKLEGIQNSDEDWLRISKQLSVGRRWPPTVLILMAKLKTNKHNFKNFVTRDCEINISFRDVIKQRRRDPIRLESITPASQKQLPKAQQKPRNSESVLCSRPLLLGHQHLFPPKKLVWLV